MHAERCRRSSCARGPRRCPTIADDAALIAQVGAHPRGARGGAEGARSRAPGRQDRLVAAGRGRDHGADADYDALAALGDDLRFVTDHLGRDGRRAAIALAIARHAERAPEVRALLALARRRRRRSARIRRSAAAASRTCSAPASRARSRERCACDCVRACTGLAPTRGCAGCWLAAPSVIAARPGDQGVDASRRSAPARSCR